MWRAVANRVGMIACSNALRVVPFYDGANVFRRARDIFKPATAPAGDINLTNETARWTHTFGLGLRIKTPVGGEFGIDFAHVLNPPRFLIPQQFGPHATYILPKNHIHFRFSQAF